MKLRFAIILSLCVLLLSCKKNFVDPASDAFIETEPPTLIPVTGLVNDAVGGYYFSNPAKESVRVLLNNMQQFATEVSVTDLSGRLVIRKMLTQGQCDIDISGLGAGMYIIRASFNGKVYTNKLMKK